MTRPSSSTADSALPAAAGGARRRLGDISVGWVLKGLILAVSAMLLAVAGLQIGGAWQQQRATDALAVLNGATDALMRAAENITNERGLTQTAITGANAAADPARQAILARRTAMVEAYEAAMRTLATLAFPERAELMRAVNDAFARVQQLRTTADAAMARPRAERDDAFIRAWYPAATDLIERMTGLWLAAAGSASAVDPNIALLNDIKAYAMAMREYAGRERAALGSGVAGNVAGVAARRDDMLDWLARADFAWRRIEELSAHGRAGALVAGAVERTRAAFFARYVPVRDAARTELLAGRPAAQTPAQWQQISNPALQAIVDIRDAAIAASTDHLAARAGEATWQLASAVLICLVGLLLSGVAAVAVDRRVVRPIRRVSTAMAAVASGDLDATLPAVLRQDEIGSLTRSCHAFHGAARAAHAAAERERGEQARLAAERRTLEARIESFKAAIGTVTAQLAEASTGLNGDSRTMTAVAERTRGQAETAHGAVSVAANEVDAAMQLSRTLSEALDSVGALAREAAQTASAAVARVETSSSDAAGLATATGQIETIVGLIGAVAEQTNLLALNATIEAARAGEAGRGFAVVAAEVKSLAGQTSRATDDIRVQINGIQTAASSVLAAVEGIRDVVKNLNDVAGTIAQSVAEQSQAGAALADRLRRAGQSAAAIRAAIAALREAADETDGAARRVATAGSHVSTESAAVGGACERFFAELKHA